MNPTPAKRSRRTVQEENRVFNEEWEEMYFFVGLPGEKEKMLCLLCDAVLATIKKANAQSHYKTHAAHKCAVLEGEARLTALKKLKANRNKQQNIFKKVTEQANGAVQATYKVAYLLA